jgi:outer membrane lipoprotein SlyB
LNEGSGLNQWRHEHENNCCFWIVSSVLNMKTPGSCASLSFGCASGRGGDDYERTEARRVYEVKMGVVESVRTVKLEGTESGIGAAAGGAVGGIAGSGVGGGKGSIVGAVIGAVVGGIAGAAAKKWQRENPGWRSSSDLIPAARLR